MGPHPFPQPEGYACPQCGTYWTADQLGGDPVKDRWPIIGRCPEDSVAIYGDRPSPRDERYPIDYFAEVQR